jgi:thiamine-monophosphate kinase
MDIGKNNVTHPCKLYHLLAIKQVVGLSESRYNLTMMKLSQLGELGLIELITEILNKSGVGGASQRDVVIGSGDDAAAWHSQGLELGTTDALIQGVHFSVDNFTWEELGWKALAVNISDIAAMGGSPSYALVSLGLPPDTEVENVVALCHGMCAIAQEFNLAIIGGNIVEAPLLIISPSVIGRAGNSILTRSAALTGDKVAVTGFLGSSAAGLRMLQAGLKFDAEIASHIGQAHLRPYPRVAEGISLAQHGVQAAIDVSDGLIADLQKICQASKVAAQVWVNKVPIHPLVQAAFKEDSLQLALYGGEDYELLFTAKEEVIKQAEGVMSSKLTLIGDVVAAEPGQVTLLDETGEVVAWERGGWEHFKR